MKQTPGQDCSLTNYQRRQLIIFVTSHHYGAKQGSINFSHFARVNLCSLEIVIKANQSTFICTALNHNQRLLEVLYCELCTVWQHLKETSFNLKKKASDIIKINHPIITTF